jgi:hypothetical protein
MTATAPVIEVRPVAAPPVEPEESEGCLVVVVKPEHIKEGAPAHARMCAVALAIQDMGFGYVYVNLSGVQAGGRCYWPSEALKDWINRFDRGEPCAPDRFLLRPAGLARPNPAAVGQK